MSEWFEKHVTEGLERMERAIADQGRKIDALSERMTRVEERMHLRAATVSAIVSIVAVLVIFVIKAAL